MPRPPFNPKIDHVLVTDLDSGPEGWEVMPMEDLSVFYDPAKYDEADMIAMTTAYENGMPSQSSAATAGPLITRRKRSSSGL